MSIESAEHPFQLVALTPPGPADPSIAIAASRAGGLGVLNLEFAHDAAEARSAMVRLGQYARRAVGIRLDSAAPDLVSPILAELPEAVQVVILTATDPDNLPWYIQSLHAQSRRVWLEVTTAEQAWHDEPGVARQS